MPRKKCGCRTKMGAGIFDNIGNAFKNVGKSIGKTFANAGGFITDPNGFRSGVRVGRDMLDKLTFGQRPVSKLSALLNPALGALVAKQGFGRRRKRGGGKKKAVKF